MGRVVEWAVVVRTVRRDARVVAVQARLRERGEVAFVRQCVGDRLGARVGRRAGRRGEGVEEFSVRRRHPERDRGSAGTARLVIEHDGGAEGFRSLTDERSAPCSAISSASVSRITTSFRGRTARVERPRSLQQNPDADAVVCCTR